MDNGYESGLAKLAALEKDAITLGPAYQWAKGLLQRAGNYVRQTSFGKGVGEMFGAAAATGPGKGFAQFGRNVAGAPDDFAHGFKAQAGNAAKNGQGYYRQFKAGMRGGSDAVKNNLWANVTPEQQAFVRGTGQAAMGAGALGGGIWLGNKLYQGKVEDARQQLYPYALYAQQARQSAQPSSQTS